MHRAPGPGLAKTRDLPLVHSRTVELYRSSDYRWRELFEQADVMSEGALRDEPEGSVYYGTTSLLLPRHSLDCRTQAGLDELARLARGDPHARLRAVRIACREAQLRARGPLGSVSAELSVRVDARGIWIDVDVHAPLTEQATSPRQRAGRVPR